MRGSWLEKYGSAVVLGALAPVMAAGPALACGGLIGRNGSVNLVRTSTLAAYANGIEHYITSFEFAGAGGEFGSIVPLPGIPTSVERGGKWTLQRLSREVNPQPVFARADAAQMAGAPAEVLLETRIDALDITVLKGGAAAVGEWATNNGFLLTPDAPEVLDFYAERSPIFMAARFDAGAAAERGVDLGDGTPIHVTIPTDNPWVPLRILGLGRKAAERVDADVFLLTEKRPALLASDRRSGVSGELAAGLRLNRQQEASSGLLDDLRSDDGMAWVPSAMWLSHLQVNANPGELTYDLAVDASGAGRPSWLAAGLLSPNDSDARPVLDTDRTADIGPVRFDTDGRAEEGNRSIQMGSLVALAGVVLITAAGAVMALRRRS